MSLCISCKSILYFLLLGRREGNSLRIEVQYPEWLANVQYPEWLTNVVAVKKKNGKWRVCIDFTDLNKSYPKDPIPLPHIDKLVKATAGHQLMSFMDVFSGYNQILMHLVLLQGYAIRPEQRLIYIQKASKYDVRISNRLDYGSLHRQHVCQIPGR